MKTKIMSKELREMLVKDFQKQLAMKIIDEVAYEYIMKRMTVYGVNVVAMRQFIMLEDGLKPFARRLLWTMYHDHKLYPDGRVVKVPEFIGHVAKYHPHGSIESGFSKMVRPWENNVPLIEVRGNKGSESGETAAAVRYLDAKLSEYSYDCFFSEFDTDTAVMTQNYINSDIEPVFLPAKYPNFLVNTSTGIGWGYSASYPPFNVNEGFGLVQSLIENPNMKNVYLFPDSPRGYNIIDDGAIKEACQTGVGKVKIEAIVEYSEEDRAIYISGFPEKIMFDDVMNKITEKAKAHKISGIANMTDTSTEGNGSFSIELRKDANPYQVIDELYKANVGLRASVTFGFYFAERTCISQMGLKDACLEWVERRIQAKQKYYIKKIGRGENRMRNLGKIIPILANQTSYNKATKIIHDSADDEIAAERLKEAFKISSSQCEMLLDMRQRDSNQARVAKYEKEVADLTAKVADLRKMVVSKDSIKEVIYNDLEEGKKRYGKPRVCKVIKEGKIERQEIFYRVVVTKKYIKKLSVASKAVGVLSDDEVIGVHPEVTDNDKIIVIDTLGKSYTIPIKKLESSDAVSKGMDMGSLVGLKGEAVKSFLVNQKLIDNADKAMLSIFTSNGFVKTTPINQYITTKMELQGINLNEGDSVCWAHLYHCDEAGKDHQLIYTNSGYGISISMDIITVQDRATKGSQYLKLKEDEVVKGVSQTNLDDNVLVVTTKGFCKRCELASIFETTKRRQNMIKITGLSEGDSVLKIVPITEADEVMTAYLKSGERKKLNIKTEVPKLPRLSKGKKLIPVKLGDAIYKITLN